MIKKILHNVFVYVFIIFINFVFLEKKNVFAKVEIGKVDGVIDWEKQANYLEAQELLKIAKDINNEKKRRKQLKDAGLSRDEIRRIIKNERNAKLNGNKIIDDRNNKIEKKNSFEKEDADVENEINNLNKENKTDEFIGNIKSYDNNKKKNKTNKNLNEDKNRYIENEENIEVDLTIIPPTKKIEEYKDYSDNNSSNYNSYDDFELSRMLKKAGENINNPENFSLFTKEVARIANKNVERQMDIPKISKKNNNDNDNFYDEDYNYNDEYYSNLKKNKRYAVNYTKEKNKDVSYRKYNNKSVNSIGQQKPIINKSTSRFYANNKNNIEEDVGEQIFTSSDNVSYNNNISEKQIQAKNVGAPHPIRRESKNRNTQYQPQNISQIAYDKNNKHLQPAVFESHIINQVFENLGYENAIPLARSLINKVGNVDISDEDGNSLLMHAVARGNQSLIASLLSEGANPNKLNKDGFSPLHLAASNGDNNAIYSLMLGGGNPNLKDQNGNTSLMYASKMCDLNSIKLMMSLGGDPSIENSLTGKTSIDYAMENENKDAVSLLNIEVKKLRKNKNPVPLIS